MNKMSARSMCLKTSNRHSLFHSCVIFLVFRLQVFQPESDRTRRAWNESQMTKTKTALQCLVEWFIFGGFS